MAWFWCDSWRRAGRGVVGSGAIALSLLLTGAAYACEPVSTSPPLAQANTTVDPQLAALEQAIFEQINAHRASRGLSPLENSAVIAAASRDHSATMLAESRLSHDGFDDRVEAIAQSLPYRAAGENVAMNQGYADPATQAVQGWLNSPGHRQNIEGDFDTTGIGVVRGRDGSYYFTQIFIRQR